MSAARSVLRKLVRTIDRDITSQAGNTEWRQAVYDEFRRHAAESDADKASDLIQAAADLNFHLQSVTAHKVPTFHC